MKIPEWAAYLALWPRSMIFLCNGTGHNNQTAQQQQQQQKIGKKREKKTENVFN